MPLIACSLLDNLDLLARSCDLFRRHCVNGMEADTARCRKQVENSTAIATALVEPLGYSVAADIAAAAERTGRTVRDLVLERGLMSAATFDETVHPDRVNRLGSTSS
jgi:aspartate ammonia-lyase